MILEESGNQTKALELLDHIIIVRVLISLFYSEQYLGLSACWLYRYLHLLIAPLI
jgi:hypothetical protein